MYMATIMGWTRVTAFSEDREKAKRLAVREKKRRCRDDLDKWGWEECEEFYGAVIEEVSEGLVLTE